MIACYNAIMAEKKNNIAPKGDMVAPKDETIAQKSEPINKREVCVKILDMMMTVYKAQHELANQDFDSIVASIRNKTLNEGSAPLLTSLVNLHDEATSLKSDLGEVIDKIKAEAAHLHNLLDDGSLAGSLKDGISDLSQFAKSFFWELLSKRILAKAGVDIKTVKDHVASL